MKHKAKMILTIVIIAGFTIGCNSYNIKYPVTMKSKTVQATLTIPAVPPAENISTPPGLIAAAIYASQFKPAIMASYNALDLKKIIVDEFTKQADTISKEVSLVVSIESANVKIPSTDLTEAEQKANEYQCKYQISEANPNLETPYILDFKVIRWGHQGKNAKAYIKYYAAMYDAKTNKAVWVYYDYNNEDPSAFSGNTGFTKEKAEKFMRSVVNEAVTSCLEDIKNSK